MRRLLHDIPQFLILCLEQLFFIFDQMLSTGLFGRRVKIYNLQVGYWEVDGFSHTDIWNKDGIVDYLF